MPLFQNEANALSRWLTTEGFEFEDLLARVHELGNRTYISWCVAFEETEEESCAEQRERYETFLDEAAFVERYLGSPQIHPQYLREHLNIEQPSGECARRGCEEPATTIFVGPDELVGPKFYCQRHGDRAADALSADGDEMTYAEGPD